jgi:hypothetical protein
MHLLSDLLFPTQINKILLFSLLECPSVLLHMDESLPEISFLDHQSINKLGHHYFFIGFVNSELSFLVRETKTLIGMWRVHEELVVQLIKQHNFWSSIECQVFLGEFVEHVVLLLVVWVCVFYLLDFILRFITTLELF